MRTLTKAAFLGVGALLVASPALAWTVQPAPATASNSSRFIDPDEALESTGSSLRDSVVGGGLGAQGGGAFTGGSSAAPYGYSSQSYGFGPFTATTQTYSDGAANGFGGGGAYGLPPLPLWAPHPR